MKVKTALAITTGVATLGALFFGGLVYRARDIEPQDWDETFSELIPTASGDLETNWGSTPKDIRPLFLHMENVSRIAGSGRIFSVIAYGESRWVHTAHNNDDRETDASRRAYNNRKDKNPPLTYGKESGEFGSGGLFGALAPYYLWTGAPEIGKRAPLLNEHPDTMFVPRYAGFAAIVYLKRLIRNWNLRDHLDIKVGWASPSLLTTKGRATQTYSDVRDKFEGHAEKVGIDLFDTATIPNKLDASNFPGVLEVYERMMT